MFANHFIVYQNTQNTGTGKNGPKFNVVKELIRECYKQGYSKKEIHTLVKFIEWVIRFSKALEKQLKEEIKKIEEEFKMPYLASWERSAKREGIKEEKIKTAKRMLLNDFSVEQVITAAGLTEIEQHLTKHYGIGSREIPVKQVCKFFVL